MAGCQLADIVLDVNDEVRVPGPAVDVDADDTLLTGGGVTARGRLSHSGQQNCLEEEFT